MKKFFYSILFVAVVFSARQASAQGCVAVRNLTNGTSPGGNPAKTWQFSMNYRYFKSYKHFVGTEEQKHRVENGTEVINHDNSVILGASYTLNPKWVFSVSVPLLYIDRSSLYEHYGNTPAKATTPNPRFHTQSQGLGDVRLVADYALLRTGKLNLFAGAGVKLPTGNYNYKDQFHKRGKQGQDSLVTRVVDQSIQPGDGGFGIVTEFDASYMISNSLTGYATGMYLLNPRNTNGIERSSTLTNDANGNPIPKSNQFSVADQYFLRMGVRYKFLKSFEFGLGGRIECVTSHDLIGREDGFRRPGYIISADPSIVYGTGNHVFALNVPVAIVRNRTRNTIDIARGMDLNPSSERYGKPIHGDAAFADYLISVSYAYKLTKKVF
jgi:hypothetical protein